MTRHRLSSSEDRTSPKGGSRNVLILALAMLRSLFKMRPCMYCSKLA